ncbi:hypothetical protein EMCRGX_G004770 [Ephydatia muelleri]
MDEILRRLTGKCFCLLIKAKASDFCDLNQLGVAYPLDRRKVHPILWHPMGHLSSESGVQQGDPLGPLQFALVLHKVINAIGADDERLDQLYQAWYMDDGVLAGTPYGSNCALCPDSTLDPLGHHAATCKCGGDAVLRHNKLRDILVESFHLAHIHVQVEAGSGLSHDCSHSWPADILVLRDHGKPVALDLSVISPLNVKEAV